MTIKKVETPGLEKALIRASNAWKITHHRLFYLSPENADGVTVTGDGVTVWDLCFLEDLLQAENTAQGLLLDVGWYPHADPSGAFRLVVVRSLGDEPRQKSRSPYDWENPVVDYETRSIDELLERIHQVIAS